MKRTKTRRDIKGKLIAAISMLMVSVIMLASSSYAWFTLSTSPEVKGIQTAVGANGNLEIALLSTTSSFTTPDSISSAVGDSSAATGKSPITANITWGNLVDLSHESYGTGHITLIPTQLNSGDGTPVAGNTIATQMLAVPMYGADGRVTELTAKNTILAPFDATKSVFAKVADTAPAEAIRYGMRAVGSSTNRSIREITYDTYMSQGNQATSMAKSDAITSLNSYGAVLANIGIKGGMEGDGAIFDKNVLDSMQAMLDSIVGYDDGVTQTPGITDKIQTALENYAIAAVASGWNENTYSTDEEFTTAMDAVRANPASAYSMIGDLGTEFTKAAAELTAIDTAAGQAQSELNTLKAQNKGSYTFADLKPVLGKLFNTSSMTVCGMTVAEIKADGGKAALMTAFGNYNNQIVVEMNGGIYSEIADLTDKFSSAKVNLEIPELGATPSTMQANRTQAVTKGILNGIGTQAASKKAPAGTTDNPVISDAFGYVIDLAFRTNASDSNLLLQTAAEARVEGAETDTMGGGSNMTFTSIEGFPTSEMVKLMAHINVVFFDNDGTNNTILAVAKLDTDNATVNGNNVTADLKIVDNNAQGDGVITNMPSNTAKKVSALIYLDGRTITNEDVGTGALSMTGRINLQFSSSAKLTPMKYNAGYAAANPVPETTATPTP